MASHQTSSLYAYDTQLTAMICIPACIDGQGNSLWPLQFVSANYTALYQYGTLLCIRKCNLIGGGQIKVTLSTKRKHKSFPISVELCICV